MLNRRKFRWKVQVQRDTGQLVSEHVETYWSPTFEGVRSMIADTARVQVQVRTKAPAAAIGGAELLDA